MDSPSISVIVPTYNERDNVRPLVDRMRRALAGLDFEVVFVDDSEDETHEVIARLAKEDPRIRLVRRTGRRGLATAVVDGVAVARGGICCVLDADLQHPPEALRLLLRALEATAADVAVASRYVPGGSYRTFTCGRRLASWVATMLARLLIRRARLIADPMSGFFAFRRAILDGIVLRPVGYKILLEVLTRARIRKVAEVPYAFDARAGGRSKLTLRQNWEYLAHLARLARAHPEDLRAVRFAAVGGSGVVVNTGVLWGLVRGGLHYAEAGPIAILAATTWNFCWNDAFTWGDRRSRTAVELGGRYVRYWAITGLGSALQYAVLLGLTALGCPYLLANLFGIGAASVWNFGALGRWTWTDSEERIQRVLYGAASASNEQAVSV
ncbi:MAG: glycosyltransferase family 2 protein [Chloroflexi bacterium]|nr:glycosyltransferase family 2 protein [Chloroflexota bacterium]